MSRFVWFHAEEGSQTTLIVNVDEISFIDSPRITLRSGEILLTCETNKDIWEKLELSSKVNP